MKRDPSFLLQFPVPADRRPCSAVELLRWAATKKGEDYLAIQADDGDYVVVRRRKLLDAKRALRRFADLTVAVLDHAVRFRWHAGRGGLLLRDLQRSEPSLPRTEGPERRLYCQVETDTGSGSTIYDTPLFTRAA